MTVYWRSAAKRPTDAGRVNVVPRPGGYPAERSPSVTFVGRILAVTLPRKLLASLATIAAAAGLMAFGTFGAFETGDDDGFPHAVIAPTE